LNWREYSYGPNGSQGRTAEQVAWQGQIPPDLYITEKEDKMKDSGIDN
jgi:hypothetical protein